MPAKMLSQPRRKTARTRRPPRRREFQPLEPQPTIRSIYDESVELLPVARPLPAARDWPRRALVGLFAVTMIGFSILPIANQLFHPPGDNKDYDIWYKAGREVLEGQGLYSPRELAGTRAFEFMYPPAAAVFLAPLTAFGKFPFLIFLDVLNSLSWIASLYLSVKLCTRDGVRPPITAYLLPALCTLSYVYDAFLLGQPNLMLLACFLAAFNALRDKRDVTAGALFAFATACKAFPVLALGYLVFRRQWRAAVAMIAFVGLFLVVLPAPVRGLGRTVDELKTWTGGMLMRYNGNGIAQRPGASYEWKNASLLASAHRLLRHVPAENPDEINPVYVNVADLDFRSVTGIAVAVGFGLCLACMVASPRFAKRTNGTDALEWAMLLVLMTILTPISWFYYGVWLMLPFAVVGASIGQLPSGTLARRVAIGSLVACLLLLNAVLPWLGSLRDIGMPFFGYMLLLLELGWLLTLASRRSSSVGRGFNSRRTQLELAGA
jgi:Glycosyltransferase family 87